MHSATVESEIEALIGAPLLDIDKTKSAGWRPGDDMPDWWGQSGAVCGGTVAMKRDGDTAVFVPVLCKRWSCEVCSYYRYAWLVRNIADQIESSRLRFMWTLTLQANTRTAEESFADLQAAWRKLRDRIRRKHADFEYVWVVETTKRGVAHMHVLVNQRLDWHWMSASWLECTGDSMVVRFDRIRNGGAASYIAKYVSKEVRARRDRGGDVRTWHLFGRSQGVKFSPFMPQGEGWEVVQTSWRENAEWLRRHTYCEDARPGGLPVMYARMWGPNVHLRAWDTPAIRGPS